MDSPTGQLAPVPDKNFLNIFFLWNDGSIAGQDEMNCQCLIEGAIALRCRDLKTMLKAAKKRGRARGRDIKAQTGKLFDLSQALAAH